MDNTTEKLMQVDCLLWAKLRGLKLRDGVTFDLAGMPYLGGLINCDKKVFNVRKAAQGCVTTTKFIESVHSCVYRKFDQNIMYMMPYVTSAEKLSKVSFDPIFDFNPWLKKMVNTNTAGIKEINGRSIVFVGAQSKKVGNTNEKDSDALRSIPCDMIVRDELDLMDMDMVYMSKQRLKRSKFSYEFNFGSPTYPNYGIDELYENSDQRMWQIKCNSCGKYTHLASEFPKSIAFRGGKWIRVCVHCGSEISVLDGHWEAEYPDRREGGLWISGLMSPFADLEEMMYQWDNTEGQRRCEFMRTSLGLASTETENQLSEQDVLMTCTNLAPQVMSTGETCMGVDVGDTLHVVVGIRIDKDRYDILNVMTVNDFDELDVIAKKFNVKSCVIDAMPDIHQSKKFQNSQRYRVYRCFYNENMLEKPNFNKDGIVKCNRNEYCDKVYDTFIGNRVMLPKITPEIKKFAYQLTRTARRVEVHPDTGIAKAKWIKLSGGEDHYFHAFIYFLLAASRVSTRRRNQVDVQRRKFCVNKFAI